MIQFSLNDRSGVPPYLQIVAQVKQAILLGRLKAGDRLPAVREVVLQVAINPNTVFKAYRQLEQEGAVEVRHGLGAFVRTTARPIPAGALAGLRRGLNRWLMSAEAAGLDRDMIQALFASTFQESTLAGEETA
jgi:GntR family transcriptional regulator